jgi:hypothetical protein
LTIALHKSFVVIEEISLELVSRALRIWAINGVGLGVALFRGHTRGSNEREETSNSRIIDQNIEETKAYSLASLRELPVKLWVQDDSNEGNANTIESGAFPSLFSIRFGVTLIDIHDAPGATI